MPRGSPSVTKTAENAVPQDLTMMVLPPPPPTSMGASKATAKREVLVSRKEWLIRRRQKTDSGNA